MKSYTFIHGMLVSSFLGELYRNFHIKNEIGYIINDMVPSNFLETVCPES